MRYADVLLMLAEAENELNGPTELVYKSINAIRKRALMPELPPKLSKEQMRNKIRKAHDCLSLLYRMKAESLFRNR